MLNRLLKTNIIKQGLCLIVFFISYQSFAHSLTDQQASRFLTQSTFGPTQADITHLQQIGIDNWIEEQLNLPISSHEAMYLTPFPKRQQINRENAWYQIVISSEDQLRQRVAFALSELLVVSRYGGKLDSRAYALSRYYDILVNHAFGNYRDLLGEVSRSAVMGNYLSLIGSVKADPEKGIYPDENYARELMQLFTIGLYELNLDGTQVLTDLKPIPTYHQSDIQEVARALTGWSFDDRRFLKPMRHDPRYHDTGSKSFLGQTIPAHQSGEQDLDAVLDILFAHPNVAQFVSKHLILRLVTSNPSPQYVERIANVFNDNGDGAKGDLSAVVTAILTDPEARGLGTHPPIKVKEPLLVMTQFHRAFNLQPDGDRLNMMTHMFNRINQGPLRSPSVFNFFSPDFAPQGDLTNLGMFAPEMQLLDATVYTQMVNYMMEQIYKPEQVTMSLDLEPFYAALDDKHAFIDLIDGSLFANAMSDELKHQLELVLSHYESDDEDSQTTKFHHVMFVALSHQEFFIQQ